MKNNGGGTLEYLVIEGGKPLSGSIRVQGAKNAALPIFAATVLAQGIHVIRDVPNLTDIRAMCEILEALGAKIKNADTTYYIDTTNVNKTHIPEELMRKMRSSIFLMGPLLGRLGEVSVSRPGGCAIGSRPIDIHLHGLIKLGAYITEGEEAVHCSSTKLCGTEISFAFPSVGATENIMMAAALAEGKTTLLNAAREPEIIDLAQFLNKMGGKISGAGTTAIHIEGVKELVPATHTIIPDRIVIGTLIAATGATSGEISITPVVPEHLISVLNAMRHCGIEFECKDNILHIKSPRRLQSINDIITEPYPGFPTDMQPQLISLLSIADGTSVITEKIFESRLKHIQELIRMGANISRKDSTVMIHGVPRLKGASISATDLRAGAALVIAGLAAEGITRVHGMEHIDRGYDSIETMFSTIGGDIKRECVDDLLYVSNRMEK